MKLTHMLAAIGLTVATLATAAPAEAQRGNDRWDRHDRGRHIGHDRRGDRRWDRNDRRRWDKHDRRRWDRHDRRRGGYASRYGYGNRCWSEWRYNQRVRICR